MIPSSDEENMIETSPSALYSNLLLWTLAELKLWGPVQPVEKKFEILIEYSLENKESIKKTVYDFELYEGDMIKTSPSAPYSNLLLRTPTELEFLGRPHFLSLAWCEQLGNWPWRHSKMNYPLALHWTADEPTQGSKIDQAQKGGHGGAIWRDWVHVTPLR